MAGTALGTWHPGGMNESARDMLEVFLDAG
jgi:hypothetical protein